MTAENQHRKQSHHRNLDAGVHVALDMLRQVGCLLPKRLHALFMSLGTSPALIDTNGTSS